MLRLPKAVRLRGTSSLLGISSTSKINTLPFTTVGSASRSKLVHAGKPSITLGRDSKLTAAFSTHSGGLRKAIWVDLTWAEMREYNSHAARLAFEKSNPFNDPKAHNCAIVFQYPPRGFPCSVVQISSAHGFGEGEATIVQKELNKVIEAAGNTTVSYTALSEKKAVSQEDTDTLQTEWPVIRKQEDSYRSSQHHIAPDLHIAFKLPSTEDPEAFFARLTKAGLRGGELMVSSGAEETNEWWERLLYCMPENDKYW
jgi:hypothetical protein